MQEAIVFFTRWKDCILMKMFLSLILNKRFTFLPGKCTGMMLRFVSVLHIFHLQSQAQRWISVACYAMARVVLSVKKRVGLKFWEVAWCIPMFYRIAVLIRINIPVSLLAWV